MKPIAITSGSYFGIGPEVISKGLFRLIKNESNSLKPQDFVIFGDPNLYLSFQKYLPKPWSIFDEDEWNSSKFLKSRALRFVVPKVPKKKLSFKEAYLSGRFIELATLGCLKGDFSALVTGPIDKNELILGGFPFDGHTEMLQTICGSKAVTMLMDSPGMRVSLATTHIPLKDVSKVLSQKKIETALFQTHDFLKKQLSIAHPKIAVLGLNPHAGDKGLFGSEEDTKIKPAIATLRQENFFVEGPFPADGFFAQWKKRYSKVFDAVVCMYHDQGLIPIKLWDFDKCVNVTLGLPIIRTSVDHGVGFDIVGKNMANSSSFESAFKLAKRLIK